MYNIEIHECLKSVPENEIKKLYIPLFVRRDHIESK